MLNTDEFLDRCNEVSGGTTRQRISRGNLGELTLDVPPLPEQRKIARILTTVDNLIEQTEALIEKYKSIKQGMMHDLFTRGVDSTGTLRPSYEDSPELYKESELGWIPKEWEVEKCISLCREIVVGIVIQPTQYYTDWGVPVLRSANVREDGVNGDDLVFMSESSNRLLSKSMVRRGDVVTVRTGYPGTSSVITEEFDGSNCVDIIISRPASCIRSEFLAFWINSDFGKTHVLRTQGGLAQQHFNVGELKGLLVAVSPMPEQVRIEEILLNLRQREAMEREALDKLLLQKSGLMQDLLTGKVRVNVDETEGVTADV
jgi:type I restriction enzyme S subunit